MTNSRHYTGIVFVTVIEEPNLFYSIFPWQSIASFVKPWEWAKLFRNMYLISVLTCSTDLLSLLEDVIVLKSFEN